MASAEGTAGTESPGFDFLAMAMAQNEMQARKTSAILFMTSLRYCGHFDLFMPVGREAMGNTPLFFPLPSSLRPNFFENEDDDEDENEIESRHGFGIGTAVALPSW